MASMRIEYTAPVSERSPSAGMPQSFMRVIDIRKHSTEKPSRGEGMNVETGHKKSPSREDVETALLKANDLVTSLSRKLTFCYDDRIEKIVVRIIEGDSEEVIRQIPPEEMIRLSLKMDEVMGMLINKDI